MVLEHASEQLFVDGDLQLEQVVVDSVEPVAEPGGEVLLVPEQHVDERNERAIHARGCLDAALRLPQRRPVVEVVRDDDAVAVRRLDRLERDRRRRLRQCAEHTARVEPAHAVRAEEAIPVDVSRLQLRRRRVPSVGAPDGAAYTEPPLGEVEPVANLAANAVVGPPEEVCALDASLQHQVLDQPADRVVGERGDDARAQTEATAQPARDVVLAAAFPRAKRARGVDPRLARVEPEHHLAQRNEVVAALLARAQLDHPAATVAARARLVTSAKLRSATSVRSAIQLPPHASTCGTARYEASDSASMPPVGMKRACGNVAETARRNAGPPSCAAGKTLTTLQPSRRARPSSDGVAPPGKNGSPSPAQVSTTSSSVPGATAKAAPAALAACACSGESTVPAPTSMPSTSAAFAIAASAAAVRKVISMHEMPPRRSAAQRSATREGSSTATTGSTRAAASASSTACSLTGRASRRRRGAPPRGCSRRRESRGRRSLPRCPPDPPTVRPGCAPGSPRTAPDRRAGPGCCRCARSPARPR